MNCRVLARLSIFNLFLRSETMKVRFLGHACVELAGSKRIYIDPFLTDNPSAAIKWDEIEKADMILVTHDHADHIGDTVAIAKKTGAVVCSTHEIATELAEKEGLATEGMNIGGTIAIDNVKVNMVNAQHTSASGHVVGFVVEMDGKSIYHPGDTGLFGDMKLIGDFFSPDLAFIPIGDRYTMGIPSAVKAVEFLRPKKVIPVHYNTWPLIPADPEEFRKQVENRAEVIILKPGESTEI